MKESVHRLGLAAARLGAVALALAACGYLVVGAHRRSNPDPAPEGRDHAAPVTVEPVAPTAAPAPVGEQVLTVIEAPAASTMPTEFDPRVFLPTSKSTVIDGSDLSPLEDPTFLFSSKVGVISLPESGQPAAAAAAVAPTVPAVPPQYLPSSKARVVQRSELIPAPAPSAPPEAPPAPPAKAKP